MILTALSLTDIKMLLNSKRF